jgi:hypothetical protein
MLLKCSDISGNGFVEADFALNTSNAMNTTFHDVKKGFEHGRNPAIPPPAAHIFIYDVLSRIIRTSCYAKVDVSLNLMRGTYQRKSWVHTVLLF